MKNNFVFPKKSIGDDTVFIPGSDGLTLREYFIAAALTGLSVQAISGRHNTNTPQNNIEIAIRAVNQADAVMKILEE